MKKSGPKAIMCGCCFLLLACAPGAHADDDVPIATFEEHDGTAQTWKHEGTAFSEPLRKRQHGRVKVIGARGEMLLTSLSWEGDDGATGRTRSPGFEIERKFIRFLVSGGNYPGRTCVNLLVDGKAVRSVAGRNGMTLEAVAFDVSSLNGKTAHIEIVDEEQRPWGHISVDHIVQSDAAGTPRIIRTGTCGFRGIAQTREGRMEGDVQLRDGVLRVDGKPLPLETVHFVVMPARSPHQPQPHAVRLVNGEVWRAQIGSFSRDKLEVLGGLFNEQVVEVASLAALDFSVEAALGLPLLGVKQPGGEEPGPGVLYRTQGRPIPGKLVWIKPNDVAVDCPLGILPLPRSGLVRYVFPGRGVEREPVPKNTADEISLRDGSILRGRLRFEQRNVVLEHPILETVSLPWDEVRYLIRGNGEITWLADLQRTTTELLGPLAAPAAPRLVDLRRSGGGFLWSLQVKAKTVARYKLPPGGGGPRTFRAVLAPEGGCRGDVTVSLQVSGQPIFEGELSPADPPQNLSLTLPRGDELELHVDFGERLAYPCGVDFLDAHVAAPRTQREVSDR